MSGLAAIIQLTDFCIGKSRIQDDKFVMSQGPTMELLFFLIDTPTRQRSPIQRVKLWDNGLNSGKATRPTSTSVAALLKCLMPFGV